MSTYYRIHHIDGEIRSSHTCSTGLPPAESPAEGQIVDIESEGGMPSADSHHIVDGRLVAYTNEQRAAKAARPMHPAHWCNSAMCWIDDRSAADLAAIERGRVVAQIAREEAGQARASREALLAICQALQITPGRLADIEAAVAALRAQMPRSQP